MKRIITILPILLFTFLAEAQSKKGVKPLDIVATQNSKLPGLHQDVELTAYTTGLGTRSKGVLPDPKMAESALTINFVATPSPGHEAIAVYVNFVPDAPLLPNATYSANEKAVYVDLPASYYKPLTDLIAATIDKPQSTKKLKAFYFDDNTGKSTCIFIAQ